jgi:UDP-N-acetylglucosamine--N-acetylmuramyl-(pentapeptide) pyrophosphoryl-undecaprenol N-acetylglucosamine transferase
MDNHQMANAKAVAETGGAWVIDETEFTSEWLKTKLEELFNNPTQLTEAAQKIKGAGHPDAADKLYALVENIAGK